MFLTEVGILREICPSFSIAVWILLPSVVFAGTLGWFNIWDHEKTADNLADLTLTDQGNVANMNTLTSYGNPSMVDIMVLDG